MIESDDDESSSVIAAQPSVPVIVFTGTNEVSIHVLYNYTHKSVEPPNSVD